MRNMMRKRKKSKKEKLEDPNSEIVLDLLKAGTLLTAVFLFPGAAKSLSNLFYQRKEYEPWRKFDQSRLRQIVKRLVKRKLLSIEEKKNESTVTITENGKKQILKYNLEKLKIEKPKEWDGKWHVVIFDVSEKKHHLRDILREKMKILGFFPLQKSVFIHPFPCEKEIAFLRQVYHIGNEVSVFMAINPEEESYLREYFKLI